MYLLGWIHYSSEEGNYISQDPIGLLGGMVLYGYVSDVNRWLDVFGLSALGGSHGVVTSLNIGNGGESNHMPAFSSTNKASKVKANQPTGPNISKYSGPSTYMNKADHMKTASWGNRGTVRIWREVQEDLIRNGKFGKAMEMDIKDVKRKFGNKYNNGMKDMIDYAIDKGYVINKEGNRLKRKYLHH
ncbi:hypothetical protein GJV76_15470 [Myroides sp. BIT-d1]|uniref:RHS repeat-associated core domain-containing protein n=1 Tax=Myroides albus TaxID=2562892 RepID=A0A6I3LPZ0_9FLAO|nr:hypothetical protein [Myroides albus]